MVLKEHDIVVGSLVQWSGAKTYGVVTNRDDKVIYVRWDEDGPPCQFVANAPPFSESP